MELIVFESCLQRPKDVIFEGLSSEGLIMVVWGKEEENEEEEGRESLEDLRVRERTEVEKRKVDVCVCRVHGHRY